MRIILLGAPGVGKGTYADALSKKYMVPHISTGNILRDAVKNSTELGKKAKSFMDTGKLVPDCLMIDLVKDRLKKEDSKNGFILDGYPRTLSQANSLKEVLDNIGRPFGCPINFVINVTATVNTIVKRLTTRRICKNCGANFNILTMKPKKEGICDNCGNKLIQRDDDREDVIKKRLIVYRNDTEPLIDYYNRAGILKTVNSDGEIEEVIQNIITILKQCISY